MFEKFDALIGEDDKISKDDLMVVLKEELTDVSVFDLMIISAEIIENSSLHAAERAWDTVNEKTREVLTISAKAAVATLFDMEPMIVEDDEDSFTADFNIVKLTDNELVISIKEDWHNGDSETIYYYKKKDFVKKSVNEVVLGEWELSYWETYDLDNNEMLESGVEVPDEDWFTSLNIKENTCEIGFGGETVEVQYTIINNCLVFFIGNDNYSLTLPIESLSGERLTISKNEFLNDGSGNEVNGQILLYYNKK